ncbi:MAG: ribonuclease P protein component [Nevskiales bacterium]|nr:ribonuclease P protein component [Nevskiales bacterium]
MRKPGEFKAVLAEGRRLHESLLTVIVRPNVMKQPRLGFAIAARTVPTAVARNRIKRHTRESFRLNRDRLPAADIVIFARAGAGKARVSELRATLERFWKRLEVQN